MKPHSTTLISCFVSSLSFSQAQQPASLTQKQMGNLVAFTKLYGYLKYFHPSDEASSINWDTLAVYGAEEVFTVHETEELKQTLERIFLPIAPSIAIYPSASEYSPAIKAIISTQPIDMSDWRECEVTGTIDSSASVLTIA